MKPDDHTHRLCKAAKTGDAEAASELLTLFHQRVFGYLRRLCPTEADAEDLTQRVFCKVWRGLPHFREGSSVTTWIYRISYTVYIDWCRRPKHFADQTEAWWEAVPASGPSPSDSAAANDRAATLYAIVETLDDECRQAIHLRYYEDLTLKETSEILDLPLSTLKYRLRASLDTIRSRMRETATSKL